MGGTVAHAAPNASSAQLAARTAALVARSIGEGAALGGYRASRAARPNWYTTRRERRGARVARVGVATYGHGGLR